MRTRRTKAQIEQLRTQIYEALEADHPQSVRHVFYLLMTDPRLPEPVEKSDRGYKHVQTLMTKMRIDEKIPFGWVSDASRWAYHTNTFDGAGDFLRRYASVYRADLWDDHSDYYVEVWAESRSLASVLEDDCRELAVLYPSGGFAFHSFIHESAQHMAYIDKATVVIYVGDYDPAGLIIDTKIEQGLRMHLGEDYPLAFERVAINRDQIRQYDLPTKPRKQSDRRRLDIQETVEAEAMPANTMRALVRDAVESYLAPGALQIARIAERHERRLMDGIADMLDSDPDRLERLVSGNN